MVLPLHDILGFAPPPKKLGFFSGFWLEGRTNLMKLASRFSLDIQKKNHPYKTWKVFWHQRIFFETWWSVFNPSWRINAIMFTKLKHSFNLINRSQNARTESPFWPLILRQFHILKELESNLFQWSLIAHFDLLWGFSNSFRHLIRSMSLTDKCNKKCN